MLGRRQISPSHPGMLDALLTAAVLLGATACSNAGPSKAGMVGDLPTLTLREVQRIGSVDDPDVGFSRIGRMDVGPDGNIFVVDDQDRDIRVYTRGYTTPHHRPEGKGPR